MSTSRDSYRKSTAVNSRKSFASNSPNRLSGWRPSSYRDSYMGSDFGYRGHYYRNQHLATMAQIRIIQEVNGEEIKDQDKDIEIERLKTTCASLNNKASIAEDYAIEIETLKRRL